MFLALFGSNSSATLAQRSSVIDAGNNNTVHAGDFSGMTVSGNNDHDIAGGQSTGRVVGTDSGLILGSGSLLTLAGSHSSAIVGADSVATVTGTGDGVIAGDRSAVTLSGKAQAAQLMSEVHLTISEAASGATVWSATGGRETVIDAGTGTRASVGSGSTITEAGTAGSVQTGDGSNVTVTGTQSKISAGDWSTLVIAGSSNFACAGSHAAGWVEGQSNTVAVGSATNFNIQGTNGTLSIADGGGAYVGIAASVNANVNVSGATIGTQSGVSATVTGSNNAEHFADLNVVTVVGNSNAITTGSAGALNAFGSYNDIYAGVSSHVGIGGSGLNSTTIHGFGLSGDGNGVGQQAGIFVAGGNSARLDGNFDLAVLAPGSSLGLVAGSGNGGNGLFTNGFNTVIGTSAAIYTDHDVSANVAGNGLLIETAGAGSSVNVSTFAGGPANKVNLGTGNYAGIIGSSGTVVAAQGSHIATTDFTGVSIFGDGNQVDLSTASNATVIGSGNTISSGQSASVGVIGGSNTVNLGTGGTASVIGGGNVINAATGTTTAVYDTGGTADTIRSNGNNGSVTTSSGLPSSVFVENNAQANVYGSNNLVFALPGASVGTFGDGNTTIASPGSSVVSLSERQAGVLPDSQRTVSNIANTLDHVYQEVLGRSVDQAGLDAYSGTLATNGSVSAVRSALAHSAEVQADLASTFATIGVQPPTQTEQQAFTEALSLDYNAPLAVISSTGIVANTSPSNLIAEIPVLETLDSGRTLSLGLSDGRQLHFDSTERLTDFVYALAVQKSQATDFVTDTFYRDVAWLHAVDQPLLHVADNWTDQATAYTATGNTNRAILASTAASLALKLAAQPEGSRQVQLTEKVHLKGHDTTVTVFSNTNDPFGGAIFHDIDPGPLPVLESIGVAILNIAGHLYPPLAPVAAAVDVAEAAKDFSQGQIIQGILSLAAAAGISANLVGATALAQVISTASAGVGGVYGAVQGARNGDALGVLAGVLQAAAASANGNSLLEGGVDTGSLAQRVASGLTIGATAVSVSDAFAKGDLASGLITSLGYLLSATANDLSQRNAYNADLAKTSVADISPITISDQTHVVFVGGFFDSLIDGPISKSKAAYDTLHPGQTAAYFTWDQRGELKDYLLQSGGSATVISHSWGADTAMSVVASGVHVENLITLDPVGYFHPDLTAVAANASRWQDFNAAGGRNALSNLIAGIGSSYGSAPQAFATDFRNVNLDHGNIGGSELTRRLLGAA